MPKGGIWKICYCANYDIGTDADSVVCTNTTEFTAEAGTVTVHGALGVESYFCARGGPCVVTVAGQSLNSSSDYVLVVDVGDVCGTSGTPLAWTGTASAPAASAGSSTSC